MKGYITKGIGGFYYVKTPEGIVECKPRGIIRKQKITPVAGDEVTLETENGVSVIAEIAPRKNVFVRPRQLSSEDHQSVSGVWEGSPLPAVPCSPLAVVLEEEEDEPPPNRPLHQSPPVVLSLGASGSGAGSGPALTTMFTRPFSFAVAPAAGS